MVIILYNVEKERKFAYLFLLFNTMHSITLQFINSNYFISFSYVVRTLKITYYIKRAKYY